MHRARGHVAHWQDQFLASEKGHATELFEGVEVTAAKGVNFSELWMCLLGQVLLERTGLEA